VTIGDRCRVEGRVVIGQGVSVGAGNTLKEGMRIFPGVQLPDGAIAF
jgi:mannose-1-phosphate guanylyltransferase